MPPMFAFAAGAENKLIHSMHDMAAKTEHSKQMAEYSSQRELHEHRKKLQKMSTQKILAQPGMRRENLTQQSNHQQKEHENKIEAQFRDSVLNSGVRVVDSLGVHHKIANFWQENPFKILTAIGVPTVFYIFKGREGQAHLQLQSKLMHTRVFGQFAVITFLLGLMGFKEYMDTSGKFITEDDVQARVAEMQQSRAELLMRLQRDRYEAEKVAEKRRKAHEADMKKSEVEKLVEDA